MAGIARWSRRIWRRVPGSICPAELDRLAAAVFANLGRSAVDVARSDRLASRPDDADVAVDGLEHLLAARARGNGVLIVTGHFGPWELLPLMAVRRYEPIHVVARPLDNSRLDDLLTAWRERGGNRVIRKREAVQAILHVLRRGETVGILIDQHVSEREVVVVQRRPARLCARPSLRSGGGAPEVSCGRPAAALPDGAEVRFAQRRREADCGEHRRFTAA
jgi:KDO2-lipid IV(A) lauroyltransferase